MTDPHLTQLPPPPRRRSKVWIILLAVVGVVFIICVGGIVVAVAIGGSKPTAQQTTATQPAETTTATAPNAPATAPTTTAAVPAGPKTSFGDGQYLVGKDITAGQYRATVPADSPLCYWEREKDTSGNPGSIIANGTGGPGTSVIVTVAKGDAAFKVSGCGNWTKV